MNNILDKIGDWSPQLLKELKTTFQYKNLTIILIIALIVQFYLIGASSGLNTQDKFKFFVDLEAYGMIILIITSSLILNRNFQTEYQTGTIDFIKRSPSSAASIIIGKALGVPSGIWLGILIQVPFHIALGLSLSIPITTILASYLMFIIAVLFYQGLNLLLNSFFIKQEKYIHNWIFFSFLMIFEIPLIIAFFDWNWYNTSNYTYPLKPLDIDKRVVTLLFIFFGYLIWNAIIRKFENPYKTILTKPQSYIICGIISFLTIIHQSTYYNLPDFLVLLAISWTTFLAITFSITPHRKSLIEWQNYYSSQNKDQTKYYNQLIWDDSSPIILANTINIILLTLSLTISLFKLSYLNQEKALIMIVFMASLMFILTLIIQTITFITTNKPLELTIFIIFLLLVPLPVTTINLALHWNLKTIAQAITLFTPFPGIFQVNPNLLTIITVLSLQIWLIHKLNSNFQTQLKKTAQSYLPNR